MFVPPSGEPLPTRYSLADARGGGRRVDVDKLALHLEVNDFDRGPGALDATLFSLLILRCVCACECVWMGVCECVWVRYVLCVCVDPESLARSYADFLCFLCG